MAIKANRWGGKQNYDPSTGKFASSSGATSGRAFKAFSKPKAKRKRLTMRKPIKR